MPSPVLKTSIFLALSLLASARPQTSQRHSGGFSIGVLKDWASSGNYLIYSCASQAPQVKELLEDSYLYLQTAILSTDSAAYKAYFHSADPAIITSVLKYMTAGTNMTDTRLVSSRPTLVCVNNIDPGLTTAWKLCAEEDNRVLLQSPGTAYVFLCPSFFGKKRTPQSTDCGVVSRDQTELLMNTHVAHSQYGFLVHALAGIYIRKITHIGNAPEPDELQVNKCLALPPDQAIRNPSSYALYVSSKSLFLSRSPTISVSFFRKRDTECAFIKTFEPDVQTFHPRCRFNETES